MVKKTKKSTPLAKASTNDLLFGTINNDDTNPIILLINNEYIIQEIQLLDNQLVFQKNSKDLIGHSFIELLQEQQINVKPLLHALNSNTQIIRTLKLVIHQKIYFITIIAFPERIPAYFAITMTVMNDTYKALKTYVNEIINNLPGAVYWKDKDGRYMGCNKFVAKMAGYDTPEQMIGKTDYDLCWHEFADEWRLLDLKVVEEDSTIVREEKAQLSDGSIITELTFKTPLKNELGEIIGIIGTSLDITERKQMEAALHKSQIAAEAANLAKTEFIANMSHDIRTPLTGVIGMSKIMEEKSNDIEEKQYAHWINESGKQLLSLLNGILDVISAENVNDSDLLPETFDLYRCIQDIAELELPTIKLKNLDLIIDIPDNVPQFLISDRTKLHRILLNLVGNSIKFTEKGHIGIKVKLMERVDDLVKLEFSVLDTGIGIPDDLQSKVFDRFFRVAPSYKGVYKGYGIGLHIVQSYVDLLGGEIKLSSQVNQGTTFYFELLMKIGHGENINHIDLNSSKFIENKTPTPLLTHTPIAYQSPVNAPNTPYLLLVEDNPIALKMIQIAATSTGCRYESAENARTAIELVKEKSFDLIVTDIGLPGMSGIELTSAIRQWEQSANKKPTPIVGLTAHTGGAEAQKCFQEGMNKVLIKPANFKLIQSIVEEFIAHKNPDTPDTTQDIQETDIPSEKEMFELSAYPFLDIEKGISILGNEQLFKDMITLMLHHGIDEDKIKIGQAYAKKNWEQVQSLAHKMKGGAAYCGLIKLQKACEYLELYQKGNHSKIIDKLYLQLIQIINDTKQYVADWLREH